MSRTAVVLALITSLSCSSSPDSGSDQIEPRPDAASTPELLQDVPLEAWWVDSVLPETGDTPETSTVEVEADSPEVPSPDTDGDLLSDAEEAMLGTDPLVFDTDTDGIGDGREVAEETDPLDPSSASEWHPEWNQFPRLTFGPDDIESLRARAADPAPPYDTLMDRIQAAAAPEAPPPKHDSYDPYHEYTRARVAKAAAFLALINEDPAMAQKAAEIAGTLNWHLEEVDFQSPYYSKTDIHAAEAITYYCQAYDFLMASGLLSDEELALMKSEVTTLVRQLELAVTEGPLVYLLALAQNNHNMKTYGAIGLAGLTFNDLPDSARWVNRGITETVYYLTDFQVTADGGYAEGPSYLAYGAGNVLTFLTAFHRFSQGGEHYFRNFFDTRDQNGPEFEWLSDPAVHPLVHEVFLWTLRIMMPDGLSPNIDDSARATMPAGYLAAFFDDPRFLWHWQHPALGLSSSAGLDLAVDTFALLPPDMTPEAPSWPPDQFLYEAGNCVLRTDYTEDATYLLLLGEHGKARIHGTGHEHPDAYHFLFYTGGEQWLLDGGYINWEEKGKVDKAENHNLILVDGKGPSGNQLVGFGTDTFLSDFVTEGAVKSATSSTTYEGVDFARTVALIDEYDIVFSLDRLESDKVHEYTQLWHGNGGGSSGGSYLALEWGGLWERGSMAMAVACGGTGGDPELGDSDFFHSFSHSQELTHTALSCKFTAASTVLFSAIQVGDGVSLADSPPLVAADAGAAVAVVTVEGGNSVVAVTAANPGVPGIASTPCGDVVADSHLTVFHCSPPGTLQTLANLQSP